MNRAIASVGVAKQVDEATVATNPTYYHGVSSGAMASAEVKDAVADITTGMAAPSLAYRESIALPTGFKTLAFAKVVGLYLLGILGTVTTTGASAPYTHVFTLGATLPWLTFFSKLDTWIQANGGSKLDEVTFDWDGPKPLTMTVVAQGSKFSLPLTLVIPITDETLGKFFSPVGGTFKVDVDGAVPAAMPVLGGSLSFKRGLAVDYLCDSITPGAIGESALAATVKLKVRAANMDDWRTIITGTPAGTTASNNPVIGSFETKFKSGIDTLTFAGGRVNYNSKAPDADPKGGPVDLELEGTLLAVDSVTSPITATLVNGVATY